MRRTASEVIRELESRVARLEEAMGKRASRRSIAKFVKVIRDIEKRYDIEIGRPLYNGRNALGIEVYFPDDRDIKKSLRRDEKIYIESVEFGTWSLNWK